MLVSKSIWYRNLASRTAICRYDFATQTRHLEKRMPNHKVSFKSNSPDLLENITIQPFRPADQPAVRDLVLTGLGEHWGHIDYTLNPDLDDIATTYADATFLTAWLGDELVGTGALVHEEEGVARVVRMSVDEAARRRGIGCMILDRLCESARAAGYRQIVLETTETWDGVIAFYKNYGFRAIGCRDGDMHFVMDLNSA